MGAVRQSTREREHGKLARERRLPHRALDSLVCVGLEAGVQVSRTDQDTAQKLRLSHVCVKNISLVARRIPLHRKRLPLRSSSVFPGGYGLDDARLRTGPLAWEPAGCQDVRHEVLCNVATAVCRVCRPSEAGFAISLRRWLPSPLLLVRRGCGHGGPLT